MSLLQITDLQKSYPEPLGGVRRVIDIPSLRLEEREQVALAGPSGSGKTTLLNLVAGIARADRGSLRVAGRELVGLSESERDLFRARHVGYVFQTFQLLGGYSALENVLLGMAFGPGADRRLARGLLEELGLGAHLDHRPHQLSIGQRQRVALARALANRPPLVLADEPTGSLDRRSAGEALELLCGACRKHGAALLLVSHDSEVLAEFERTIPWSELNRVAEPAAGGAR